MTPNRDHGQQTDHDRLDPLSSADAAAARESETTPLADERCCRYLLGELSAEEAAQFESQLATSPALNRELQWQSELLISLAGAPADVSLPHVAIKSNSERGLFAARGLRVAIALAASVLFALIVVRTTDTDRRQTRQADRRAGGDERATIAWSPADETLLIARAWADSATLSDSAVEDSVSGQSVAEDRVIASDAMIDSDWNEPSAETAETQESTVDWMIAAISADANIVVPAAPTSGTGHPDSGASTDG